MRLDDFNVSSIKTANETLTKLVRVRARNLILGVCIIYLFIYLSCVYI